MNKLNKNQDIQNLYFSNFFKKVGTFQISEGAGGKDFFNSILGAACILMLLLLNPAVQAIDVNMLPGGYQIQSGNINFSQNNNILNVNSASSKAIVNYQSFNVGQNATINFNLPSSNAAILNRVNGASASKIYGTINSNGHVFLINPNGIFFSRTSSVNVGSLTASTLNIEDRDFLNDNYVFRNSGSSSFIINKGRIITKEGGSVNLFAGAITNEGSIETPNGSAYLAVGDTIQMTIDNGIVLDVLVSEELKQKVQGFKDGILNTG
ncbi:MAG: filamentous hemagglutinin N-terminal domain-containing protein, partial [Candidatus Caenarcaniphilales bacterium]|nr:filamentous hemagglutinin N-terminal domain-containing protein [Candidatus Caenarcaniphilales bacterium]